jgi:hypothetical protein
MLLGCLEDIQAVGEGTLVALDSGEMTDQEAAKSLSLSSILDGQRGTYACAYLLQPIYSAMHARMWDQWDRQATVRRLAKALSMHADVLHGGVARLIDQMEAMP